MKYPFDSNAGIILVKTKLYGPVGDGIVNLALDTGATWTLVSWEIAVQLSYDPASVRDRSQITTGSGVEYCPRVKLKRLATMGKSALNVEVLCHTLPPTSRVDGLLGLNFLKRFDVRINFKQGYIDLR